LSVAYVRHGGWHFMVENPQLLNRLYWLAGEREGNISATDQRHRKGHDHHHPLGLLRPNHRRLLGAPPPRGLRKQIPIQVRGHAVGWLTYPDQDAIRDKLDRRFQARQRRFVGWMALVGLGLSLLVSWLLARHLVGPISALTKHTRQLREGDYQVRLQSRRRDE